VLIEQPVSEPPASMVQLKPVFVGKVSETLTLFAVPVPPALELVTVIKYPIESPALTAAASAVFVTEMSGHRTLILIGPEVLLARADEASFVAEAVAVFATVPQLFAVVGEIMCTLALAPGAKSPKLQLSVPVEIEHCALSGLSDQLRPALVGRVSLSVTPLAVPVPAAFEFVTVMV